MPADASRDLLFGLLALQNGLIDQGELVAAFQVWTLAKERSLAEHLCERGVLDTEDRAAVEALVARHLKKHGGSTAKSLASIRPAASMRRSLAGLDDSDLAASLPGLPSDDDSAHTVDLTPVDGEVSALRARISSDMQKLSRAVLPEKDHLDRPAESSDGHGDPSRPASAGRFRILGEIARGGMGAVHRGRDEELNRDLALKVLLERHRDRADLITRFVEEAQICGQLQHPGVVPVYELGTLADNRPFFAMKLVKGRTLGDLLAECGPGADLPRFLAIFEAICQTVAYAHSRGVIHRDLKPANVMVGAFGEVQVMDWGLAKVLPRPGETPVPEPVVHETLVATARSGGDSDLSEAGSVLGTPAYMAPEQARGETEAVDCRADVFALGSILCEILTGRPAFVGDSMLEILAKSRKSDTAEALARLGSCGADDELLDLVRACLAAEPKDRPADAGVVAAAMTGYLAGVQTRLREVELARAAETARAEEAEAKAAAERRAGRLVAALAATVLLAGGLGVGGWRWVELQRRERVRAATERVNLAILEATRLRALAQSAPTGGLAPWELATVAADKARDLLEPGIEPTLRARVEELATEAAVGRREAEAASLAARRDRTLLDQLVDIRSAEADDPGGFGTDAAYADAFRAAGLDVAGMPESELAAKIRSRPPEVATALAVALDDWAAVRRERKKDRAGAAMLSDLAAGADPDPWRCGLRRALDIPQKEDRLKALRELASAANFDALGPISLDLLGRTLKEAGDPAGAEAVLRKAQERHPDDVWINYDLAQALAKLARRDEAIRFATAARSLRPETAHELAHMLGLRGEQDAELRVFEDLARLRPRNGRHLGCLGQALKDSGRRQDAARILEAAEAANREAVRLRPDDANAHYSLATVLSRREKLDEAVDEDRAAVRLQPENANFHSGLGNDLYRKGNVEEAIDEHRTAVRLDPTNAMARVTLGIALTNLKRGNRRAAVAEFREAIRLQPDLAEAHSGLGYVLLVMMKLDEAVDEYRIAERLQPNAQNAAYVHYTIAVILDRQGKLDEAIAENRVALRLKPDYPRAKNTLAWYTVKKRDLDAEERAESLERAREAVALSPKEGNYVNTLALAEYRSGHWDESIAAAERSIALYQGLETFDWFAASPLSIAGLNRLDASNWFFLAMAHWRRGETDRARKYFRKAVAWTRAKDPTDVELLQFWGEAAELLGEPGPGALAPPAASAGEPTP